MDFLPCACAPPQQDIVLAMSICGSVCMFVTEKRLVRNRCNSTGIFVIMSCFMTQEVIRFWWHLTLTFDPESYFS